MVAQFIRLIFVFVALSSLSVAHAQSSRRRYALSVMGGYNGAVRFQDSSTDFYEGLSFGVGLGRNFGSRSQLALQYRHASPQANYTDLVPQTYTDQNFTLALKQFFGANQIFVQLGGDYCLSKGEESETSLGPSFGGGLLLHLGSRLGVGMTTLYAIHYGSAKKSVRRFLYQTIDLVFEF